MEGTSDSESRGVGAPCVEGILGSRSRRQRELAACAGRDMGCLRFSRSAHMRLNKPGVGVKSASSRRLPRELRGRWWSQLVVAAPNRVTTRSRRCRLRLVGATVEETVTKLVQACGWKGRVGNGGRESVSLLIESGWIIQVPVDN